MHISSSSSPSVLATRTLALGRPLRLPDTLTHTRGGCTRCELAERALGPVSGEGWTVSPHAFLIGEAPGREENLEGRVFCGKSGKELTRLLQFVTRIPREKFYITNLVKCRPPHNRDPLPQEIAACRCYLQEELDILQPQLLVAIGGFATRHFLGDVSLDTVHGTLHTLEDGTRVLPVFHPAAGFHNNLNLLKIQHDFTVLGEVLRNEYEHVEDAWEGREDYRLLECAEDVHAYLRDSDCYGVDTESDGKDGPPYSIQVSTSPGSAIMVLADNAPCLQVVRQYLESETAHIILHNALYDLGVMAELGITPQGRVTDTMVMAYLLQSEPQSLKALAYRHAGMVMSPYADMVSGATHLKAMQYLARALELEWPDPEPVLEWTAGGLPHIKQPQNVSKKIVRILTDQHLQGADPYARWQKIEPEGGRAMVEEVLGPMHMGYLRDIEPSDAVYYSCRDADATLRIYRPLLKRIVALKLETVLDWDMGALVMAQDMMDTGIHISKSRMQEVGEYLHFRQDAVQEEVQALLPAGSASINLGSTQQVSDLLFNQLKLNWRASKPTKTGNWATGDEVLSRLEMDHPIVPLIQEWRRYNKLRNTYADVLPRFAASDDRIHCEIKITRTETGRLSTAKPNLMAQPTRTEEGKLIRKAYTAPPGRVITTSDYSQIEMRIAACASNDPEMLRVFRHNQDLHAQTAMRIFGLQHEHEVDKMKHRYPCKRIGFGVLYGITAEGLWKQLFISGLTDWTVQDCQNLIDEWFRVYHGVRLYMDSVQLHARRYGYVRDLWGRVRFVPGVHSSDRWVRLEAERQAGNAPIQMGAAGVIKKAMRDLVPVYRRWNSQGVYVRPLLQIHDDLLFEMDESRVLEVLPEIALTMESAVKLQIPTPVDPEIGYSWGEQVPMERWRKEAL